MTWLFAKIIGINYKEFSIQNRNSPPHRPRGYGGGDNVEKGGGNISGKRGEEGKCLRVLYERVMISTYTHTHTRTHARTRTHTHTVFLA